jgi:NADH-quinone oxidoreductase subunit M
MPWLTVIGVLPSVGALVIWGSFALRADPDVEASIDAEVDRTVGPLARRNVAFARSTALATSLIVFVLTLVLAVRFDVSRAGDFQFSETHSWIPQFGVSYAVGVDGIALTMVVLSAVLVPVCVLASWHEIETERGVHFFALMLVLETFMIGVFAARDVFLFYVFFEVMLIPVYFLIGQFGGMQRRYASVKFLLYSLFGGLVMLVAVIAVYFQGPGGPQGFLTSNLTGLHYSSTTIEDLLFVGFFLAFAIKAPMWPVHTWLPDAAAEAPVGVGVLLVGVLDKVGTFGMITLCLPLFPGASKWAAPVVLALAVISVIYGALLAIGQSDIKRLIAYTSVSHFGFIVLGIFAFTSAAQAGSLLYMVNHGFSTAALFLIAGMLIARRRSQQIGDYGGLQRSTPLLAGSFLVAGLATLSLPGLAPFISEFLVLVGTFTRYPAASVIAVLGIVLAALYILLTYQRMFTGPTRDFAAGWRDMNAREAWVVGPLVAVLLVLGFYPKPVLDVLNPAVGRTMQQTSSTDPAPTVPGVQPAAEGITK